MGCGPSKEDAEGGAVSRCRERKNLLRDAVAARHALAGAHAGHAAALRNVGAALSDYAAGEPDVAAAAVVTRSASAPSAKALPPPPPPIDPVLPPPPPPPGPADASAAPLVRSLSAPDLPVGQTIKKKPSGEATIVEEEEEEGDAHGDDARRRVRDDDDVPEPPPPLPPANLPPPPSRSPPPVPSAEAEEPKPAPQANSWDEYFFGSRDAMPPPPSLDPSAAEASWAAERREPGPPPSLPPDAEQQPPPQPPAATADEVAAGKKPVTEPVARRAVTQKAARKAEGKQGRAVVMVPPQPARLGDVLRRLDDRFLRASESAHEVSKILEAARMHYHSNFAETRGFVDHSARVMQVITWNRSFKRIPQPENVKNELDDDEWETHATVLDKLLAWEKKLYHEVKEFEIIKMTYQRKLAVLNKKKQRGASSSSVEKTKAVVSHLHTKYIVDLQTMESTVAEINRLRDKQLYPKLLELVKGLWHMWDLMYAHHKTQLRIISELKSSEISVAVRETSEQHHERTVQLWSIVQEWQTQFGNFMTSQKDYVGNLYRWIKLNVIPIDTNLKPNSSQPHETTPPIKRLLHSWHDTLGKLQDERTKKAIFTFAEVVKTILVQQEEELQLRVKIEETRREHERKRRQFDDWARKNWDKGAGMNNPDGSLAAPVVERKAAVERLEQALKDLEAEYVKQCRVVRDKSLNLLRSNLPELFGAVSEFSLESAAMFKGLWSISHMDEELDE